MVDVLLPAGTLGLFVPHCQRLERKVRERSRPGVRIVATALAPGADDAAFERAAFQLVAEKPDLALLDGMSYAWSELARLCAILPCLIVLPAAAATRAAAALLSPVSNADPFGADCGPSRKRAGTTLLAERS
jgi:hypothetical protein